MAKEKKGGWPGFFRLFAVLCAIMGLAAQRGYALAPAGDQGVFRVYLLLTLWAVPALFMIWGVSALSDPAAASLPGMSARYLLPACAALFFWGMVYYIISHILGGGGFSLSLLGRGLLAPLRGDVPNHMTLLFALLGLYLLLPLLRRFTASASRGEVLWLLGLALLFGSLLPRLLALFPHNPLLIFLDRINLPVLWGYLGYFLGGWYLYHYTISRVSEFILYILGVAGLALTLLCGRFPGLELDSSTAPGVALTTAAFCTLFRYVLGVSEERSRRRAVNDLGKYAFGAYLIHYLWVLIFGWLGASLLAFPPALSVPFFAILYFSLSLPPALALGLLPGVGRWLT